MRKPSLDSEIVRKKVDALFPGVTGFEPILGGEESQAFRFDSEEGEFIFRVNADVEVFAKDRFVYERFAGPKLPIPRVFEIGKLGDHYYYCVSQRMAGRTLEDLDAERVSQLLVPTAEVWRAMAEADLGGMSGCGPFDSQGTTPFSTWRDFLVAILHSAKDAIESARRYANANAINAWLETFHVMAVSCPEERSLIHGDFGSNNVLAEGERITGVLDWSEAMIGDPLYDVANIFFWRTWLPCMEQQARYFETHVPEVAHWEERILCYQLRIGLTEVMGNALERKDEAAIWAVGRCEEIMRAIQGRDGGFSS